MGTGSRRPVNCRLSSHCFDKKHPRAAESIVRHTFRCGVLFKQSRSQRRSMTSVRRPERAMLAPRRRTSMIVRRCVRERGIHALHSIGSCCRYAADSLWRVRQRAADQTIVRHPRATGALSRSGQVFSLLLVRDSNPRQPDYWSGALSTELTCGGRLAVARFHVRNTQHQPFTWDAARRWPSDVKPCL